MKLRTDFVSNSSSSSFFIAVNRDVSIEKLAKDIALHSIDKKSPYHDPGLKKHNQLVFEYCCSMYELAFLGDLVLGEMNEAIQDPELLELCYCYSKAKAKKATDNGKKAVIENYKMSIGGLVVPKIEGSSTFMMYSFKDKDGIDTDFEPENRKVIADRIAAYAKDCYANMFREDKLETYAVTPNTLKRTQILIEEGYKLDFSEWEDDVTKKVKKHFDDGDQLFYVTENYSGDGYSSSAIYVEKDDGLATAKVPYIETISL